MAPSDDDLVRGYLAASAQVRERVRRFVESRWKAMPAHRDLDVERFISATVPHVASGQMQLARLTDAYLSRMLGIPATGVKADEVSGAAVRGGVPPEDVYRRPATTVYTELAAGKSYEVAVAAGAARLLSVLATDLQLGQRAQEQRTLKRGGATFYRRVLTGAEDCALCVIASTQRYRVGKLKPIHPGCDCGVAVLKPGEATDHVIDPALLEATHAKVATLSGGTDRGARDLGGENPVSDYLDLVVTRDHGEYGPTLTWRDHSHTGPSAVPH